MYVYNAYFLVYVFANVYNRLGNRWPYLLDENFERIQQNVFSLLLYRCENEESFLAISLVGAVEYERTCDYL